MSSSPVADAAPDLAGEPTATPDGIDDLLVTRVREEGAGLPAPRIILPEGDDERVVRAAGVLADLGLAPVLIGDAGTVGALRGEDGPRRPVLPTVEAADLAHGAAGAVIRAKAVGRHAGAADPWLSDPVHLGMAAAAAGIGDVVVAGATRPTADVIRSALRILGLAPGTALLSSSFLMKLADGRYLGFGDCAVVPNPDAAELASIARATADTFTSITGESPAVAMLSFSTAGSAEHPDLEIIRSATAALSAAHPDLEVDGELQFDAALIDSVARAKAPESTVAGHANVLIFPNLAAGNIGYKIAERLAHAQAFGPLLQGLASPVNDLSRGASATDIVNVALITALQHLTTQGRDRPSGADPTQRAAARRTGATGTRPQRSHSPRRTITRS